MQLQRRAFMSVAWLTDQHSGNLTVKMLERNERRRRAMQ